MKMKKSQMEFARIRTYYELMITIMLLEDYKVKIAMYRVYDNEVIDIIKRHRVHSKKTRASDFTDLTERDIKDDKFVKGRMIRQIECLKALKELDKKRKSFF